MSDQTTALNVTVRNLPAVHVACIRCPAQVDQGQFSQAIRESFQKVQGRVKGLGYDPYKMLTIGVIYQSAGQLSHYDCCVQVPEAIVQAEMFAFMEWLPNSGFEHAQAPEMEVYPNQGDEYCEFWLPIQPKGETPS
jgi:DNA gyrase inhibitor GyrI